MRILNLFFDTRVLTFFTLAFASCTLHAEYYEEREVCSEECCSSSWMPFGVEADLILAADTFRSLPDGSFQDNSGLYTAVNLGMDVPYFTSYNLGFQLGGSYGIYDWFGRVSDPIGNTKESQQQGFLTVGLFSLAPCCSQFNFGIAYDWMFNKNFSVFALNANFEQVRFKAGYLIGGCDEIGLWGTWHTRTAHKDYFGIPVAFRAISQINLFWEHHFSNCAQTMVWVGLPDDEGLLFAPGKDGQFILGARFEVPLTDCLKIEGHAAYMAPRSARGGNASLNYATNVSFGLTYSFGCGPCGNNGCGVKPYLPLADNSQFLSDTNLNF